MPAAPPWPAETVERWPVDRPRPSPRNARTHSDEEVAQLAAAIREYGWTFPLLCDEQDEIIVGHRRQMAARLLGLDFLPVMVARGWTDQQKRAYRLADNKIALDAGWDNELLKVELNDLLEMGAVELSGFSMAEATQLLAAGDGGSDDAGGSSGGGYQEQYGVIVMCRDEAHQREVYETLLAAGHEVKVVAT